MVISEVKITNFKSFKDTFTLKLDPHLNILVGLNEAGKSTILEAIHLACSGIYDGKPIKNEISQNLFNSQCVEEYLQSLKTNPISLPEITIEIFLTDIIDEYYKGDKNSYTDPDKSGFKFIISFNESSFKDSYNEFIKNPEQIKSLPVEYYDITWISFARKSLLPRDIIFKSSFIDSSSIKSTSGCDVHFTKILRDCLTDADKVNISQTHRKMVDDFRNNENIVALNSKIQEQTKITDKNISISVELQTKNAWENSITTLMDGIPYAFIGKGEQSIIKTNLAMLSEKTKKASVVLIEEPESHLTYSKLNYLIKTIKDNNIDKQIIMTTHSSFVANKLGLKNLTLINNRQILTLNDLQNDTYDFFLKISGYDTLRLILAKKIILVEGDSDELIVQRAYMDKHNGLLPIENNIDVMSVGLSFLRFLEIAEKLNTKVCVVTDNDGNVNSILTKYSGYLGNNKKDNIKICYDSLVDPELFKLEGDKTFNFNTLEPKILKANNLELLNEILGTDFDNIKNLLLFMHSNKTDVALKIFDSDKKITFPQYILDSLED